MTNTTDITCPKCGADIPLSEAISHRLREQLEAEFARKREALNATLVEREQELAAEAASLAKRAESVQAEICQQLETERAKIREEAAAAASAAQSAKLKFLEEQVAKQGDKLALAQQAELDLLKQKQELETAKTEMELEVARKLAAERTQISDTARQQAVEEERLKLADKDNLIGSLKKQIADLQQKAEQGSMQAQGETLELTLESDLRTAFPADLIGEVKKGERGADVLQRTRTNAGLECGGILWEAKRAKHWSAQWPDKLKEDQRAAGAELAVLVTTSPPAEVRGIDRLDGVWVCEPAFAIALAAALRQGLVATATQRLQDTDRSSKMALLYDHLCGVEFRQHIQAVVESFVALQEQLNSEQRAFARQWKEREKQIQRAIRHTAELYGGVQGIAGREALPDVGALELPE